MAFNSLAAKKRPGLIKASGIRSGAGMARHPPGVATMSENNSVEGQCNHLVLDAVKFSIPAAEVGVSKSFEHLWFAERRLSISELSLYHK